MPPFRGKDPWTATEAAQIIVEGHDDQMVLDALAGALRDGGEAIPEFDVQCGESQSKIPHRLAEFALTPRFVESVRSIAVVVDADGDPAKAFSAMQNAVREAGLTAPSTAGAWQTGEYQGVERRVRIDLVPSMGNGALETVVLAAVDAAHLKCVDAYLECIRPFGQPKAKQVDKAKVQVLAAAHLHDGYMTLGAAIRDKKLSIAHPAFDDLRNLLRALPIDSATGA